MAMVLESTDRSQSFPLDRESIFMGSSERKSDICLSASDVAEVHCELTLQTQGIRVVAMTEGGVTVNGETVREATLSTGDELGIASLRFRLTEQADGEPFKATNGEEPGNGDVIASSNEPVATQLSRWVVQMSGMNLGPLDWDELQTMIGRGEVRLDDQVQRENESNWQAVRDVLPQSGGDAWLCDDSPSESKDVILRRPRARRKSSLSRDAAEESHATAADVSDRIPKPVETPVEVEKPLAPQFFLMRSGDEVGPLPRQAIQELADDGAVQADTPVRLEDSTDWSTAMAVGFHCAAAEPTAEAAGDPAVAAGNEIPGGVAWLLFAPYYFMVGLARSVASLEPRRLIKWTAILLVAGALTFGWFRMWSQTAMRGVVTLDGQPVADVLVQLTGAGTGDSAMGVSGSNGSFRVMTLDGELKPGLYLVTVRPLSEVEGNRRPDAITTETASGSDSDASTNDSDLPERYRHLNTTDATIEITANESHYSVALTTQPLSGSAAFRGGDPSASHALQ